MMVEYSCKFATYITDTSAAQWSQSIDVSLILRVDMEGPAFEHMLTLIYQIRKHWYPTMGMQAAANAAQNSSFNQGQTYHAAYPVSTRLDTMHQATIPPQQGPSRACRPKNASLHYNHSTHHSIFRTTAVCAPSYSASTRMSCAPMPSVTTCGPLTPNLESVRSSSMRLMPIPLSSMSVSCCGCGFGC